MHVIAWRDVLGGIADDLIVLSDHRAFRDGLGRDLVAAWDQARGAHTFDGDTVRVSCNDGRVASGSHALLAIGSIPNSEGLGLETAGVEVGEGGEIRVDAYSRTSSPGIWAIGDVIPGPMLAHKAEHEGVAAVETMAGEPGHVNYDAIPGIIYTHPEVATVGKTEQQLKEAGIPYKKGKFPFMANGRAKAMGETDGMVKILAHAETDRILGFHVVGAHASDLAAEGAVAIEFSASAEDLARSVHAHPTLSEIIKEAALDVAGRVVNI